MSFLAQPLENAHHALGLATVDIQYRQDLPLGRHRVGGPVGEALDVNRASLAVLCLQALDVSLRYIKFLGYHFGTPALSSCRMAYRMDLSVSFGFTPHCDPVLLQNWDRLWLGANRPVRPQ